MKQYYSINFVAMKENGLNPTKWMILEDVHFRQAISVSGYCEDSRTNMATDHQISTGGMKKIVGDLVALNYLKRNTKNNIKTTSKWHDLMGNKNVTLGDNGGNKNVTLGEQNCYARGNKNVTPQPIRKNLERVSKSTREKEKFNFSLKKDTHYSNLSEDYKHKLFHKILLIDGGQNYDAFINALNSKSSYKYIDFSRVYRTWYKRIESADTNGREKELDGLKRFEVMYDGKAYAICPLTLDARLGNLKKPTQTAPQPKEVPNQFAAKLASTSRMEETAKKKPTYSDVIAHQSGDK